MMGYKNVCLECLRVENLRTDYNNFRTGDCPECSAPMVFVNHKFRPPKRSDKKSWNLIKFLFSHGFTFQRINRINGIGYADYPTNMEDAKKFVMKYADQAIKD